MKVSRSQRQDRPLAIYAGFAVHRAQETSSSSQAALFLDLESLCFLRAGLPPRRPSSYYNTYKQRTYQQQLLEL